MTQVDSPVLSKTSYNLILIISTLIVIAILLNLLLWCRCCKKKKPTKALRNKEVVKENDLQIFSLEQSVEEQSPETPAFIVDRDGIKFEPKEAPKITLWEPVVYNERYDKETPLQMVGFNIEEVPSESSSRN